MFSQKVDTTTELYKRRRMMIDFYEGRQMVDDEYLLDLLTENPARKKGVRNLLFTLNLTKKIVDAQSMVYKEPSKITVMREDEEDEQATETYRMYLESMSKDVISKNVEKYTNLLGRTAVGVFFDPNMPEKLRLDLIPQFVPVWNENSYNIFNPDGIAYELPKDHYVFDPTIYKAFVVWDGKNVTYQNINGQGMNLIINGQKVNGTVDHGYDMLPFIFPYNSFPTNDFFTPDMRDLVRQNQEVNYQRSLINYNLKYGSFKTAILKGVSKADSDHISMGADQIWALGSEGDAMALNLAMENVNELKELFEYTLNSIYDAHNLKSWVSDRSNVSGVSAKLQNVTLMEMRQQSIDMLKQSYEIPLYDKIQKITSTYKEFSKKLPPLGNGVKLKVEYGDYEVPTAPDEMVKEWEFKFKNNLATPVEFIAWDRGITEEEAEYIYEEIISEKAEVMSKLENNGIGKLFIKDLNNGENGNENTSRETENGNGI